MPEADFIKTQTRGITDDDLHASAVRAGVEAQFRAGRIENLRLWHQAHAHENVKSKQYHRSERQQLIDQVRVAMFHVTYANLVSVTDPHLRFARAIVISSRRFTKREGDRLLKWWKNHQAQKAINGAERRAGRRGHHAA